LLPHLGMVDPSKTFSSEFLAPSCGRAALLCSTPSTGRIRHDRPAGTTPQSGQSHADDPARRQATTSRDSPVKPSVHWQTLDHASRYSQFAGEQYSAVATRAPPTCFTTYHAVSRGVRSLAAPAPAKAAPPLLPTLELRLQWDGIRSTDTPGALRSVTSLRSGHCARLSQP
jgi:hypothetical protein